MIKFDNVTVFIPNQEGRRTLISDLSFNITVNSKMAIIGPNGSGKSTLLNIILGDDDFCQGSAIVAIKKNRIGFMPQNYRQALYPWLSVAHNIELYSNENNFSENIFNASLNAFSINNIWDTTVTKLSGGEQQLLLLCLILSRESDILLLDEPLSAVDLSRRKIARQIMKQHISEKGCSMILISHDIEDAAILTDKVMILSGSSSIPTKYIINDVNTKNFSERIRESIHS